MGNNIIHEWMPTYLCYGGYNRMLSTLYQMTVERRAITIEEVSNEMDLMKHSVEAGLIFLESINVVKKTNEKEYMLTEVGIEYSNAIAHGKNENIGKMAYTILMGSCLSSIARDIEADAEKMSIEEMYSLVKNKTGISDVEGPFGIKHDHLSGVDSLLHIFQSAGIIPGRVNLEAALQQELKRVAK